VRGEVNMEHTAWMMKHTTVPAISHPLHTGAFQPTLLTDRRIAVWEDFDNGCWDVLEEHNDMTNSEIFLHTARYPH
jgi:hypothetical protein